MPWVARGAHPRLIRKVIMVINMTALLMIITLLQVSADGFVQISLKKKGTSLEKIFKSIEKQTDYVFFSKDFDIRNLNIEVTDAPIESVLDLCFKDLPLSYKIIGRTIVVKEEEGATPEVIASPLQEMVVQGKVTDQKGAPLPGVAVRLKGTSQGTVTDGNGEYTVAVPGADAVLVFSFIGFSSQEVTVGTADKIDVKLTEEISTLEEVVVVGYGTQKKINLTGAVDVVDGEQLSNRPAPNMSMLLQGAAPNMNISLNSFGGEPGATQLWQIRGVGAISGNTAPLILVDGVETNVNNIDPDTVESVSIL